ncbi:ANTAR domain-containing protein [Streptomyces sp. AM6-12]|uniref:ANTAR domain-containing protein n=1 Tax=Streptomyces sp. AM6-12 TaxID=3345149 RepID=UPI0037B43CCC
MGEDGLTQDEALMLRRENGQLKHAMESRPVIDMARGVLMAGFGCNPGGQPARVGVVREVGRQWEILVTISQRTNTKLRDVAEAVTLAAAGKPMPEGLQEHLATAVQSWQAGRT